MKVLCGVLLVALVSGCSGSAGETSGGAAGAAGSPAAGGSGGSGAAGTAGGAGAAGANSVQPVAIWNDDSAKLRVVRGDFFSGYSAFERTRAQLSAAQLAELEQLRTAPELDACVEDGLNIQFTVTDALGMTESYVNDSCSTARQNVDPAAAEHFLESLPPCVASKDERSLALASAPSVAIGDGCLNGLFTSSTETPSQLFLRLAVPVANVPVQLELSECGQRTFKLELLDPVGATLLATSASSATSCPALSYSFAETGSYVVRVTLMSGPGAGDFWFRAN